MNNYLLIFLAIFTTTRRAANGFSVVVGIDSSWKTGKTNNQKSRKKSYINNMSMSALCIDDDGVIIYKKEYMNRRQILSSMLLLAIATTTDAPLSHGLQQLQSVANAADNANSIPTSLKELSPLLKEARAQLDTIPTLIQEGKWDSVRAILITPPISDCWSKSSKLLLNVANAIGEELPDGDELAALEAREDAVSHLRYLDMAVYNNNFNPIATEGETGATKELIRSYYEDPKNELRASIKALDEIIDMIP